MCILGRISPILSTVLRNFWSNLFTRACPAIFTLALVTQAMLPQLPAAPQDIYTVYSPLDDGSGGTLRAAIDFINTNPGYDTINFNITGCPVGVCTITLSSPLPDITSITGSIIDGYSQPNATQASGSNPATLKIVINGNGFNCFTISGVGHTIRGLVIQDCGIGVRIQGTGASENVIAGNHIGTNANGGVSAGNTHAGAWISGGAHDNTIGGDEPAERNVISGNDTYGVRIEDNITHENIVSGNYIGTNSSGTLDLGNGYSGIHINNAYNNTIGGDLFFEKNVISGNERHGIYIRGVNTHSNEVIGNIIGASFDEIDDLPNTLDGVHISEGAHNNTIGGSESGERNLILGNSGQGIRLDGSGVSGNQVMGNYIGLHGGDWPGMGNTNGVYILNGAQGNTIGGQTIGARNIISANTECGVRIEGNNTDQNVVMGNYIGTSTTGNRAPDDLGNGQDGVLITGGASQNTIGGDSQGERNVISDNAWSGVSIYGGNTISNTVSGNIIGLSANGTQAMGNSLIGVFIGWGAQENTIGGITLEERNLISGNVQDGVQVRGDQTDGNVILGNWIGLKPDGSTALANGGDGVRIYEGARHNRVGGDSASERNIVSGNLMSGVSIYGSETMSNTVTGNYVGTDASGSSALPNTLYGVYLGYETKYNTIGGLEGGQRNLISGNTQDGVRIEHSGTDYNQLVGNYIGLNALGSAALANVWNGVQVSGGAQHNTIGPANVIAFNTRNGVLVDGASTSGDWITQNSIHTNGWAGIDLANGANQNIQPPIIDGVTINSHVQIEGSACSGCTVEIFQSPNNDGEGQNWLGSATAGMGGRFALVVPSVSQPYMTATATDAIQGTSEFSSVYLSELLVKLYLPLAIK